MTIRTIPFTKTVRAPDDIGLIEQALEGGYLHGDGPFTLRAQKSLSGLLDGATTTLTTSCTHALEMMAILFDIGPGDEVVVPSFTFPSTANASALRGARIRFADIDPDTLSMELPQLEAAVTTGTKAVFLVEYGGVSRDLESMVEFCRQRGIAVGEDAAHALFARHNGRPCGTFGDLAALSFHNTKNISCGEGGALVINDQRYLERAHILREKGTDRSRFLRGEVDKYTWRDVGSSWLPSDLLAAMLCSQLEGSEALQRTRLAAWEAYHTVLSPHAPHRFRIQGIPPGVEHPAHVFAVVLPNPGLRGELIRAMRDRGIMCVSHYEPLHLSFAAARFGIEAQSLPQTEYVAPRLLRLPLYSSLQPADAIMVAEAFLECLNAIESR